MFEKENISKPVIKKDNWADKISCSRSTSSPVPVHETVHDFKKLKYSLDYQLKEFIRLSDCLEDCIENITSIKDSPRANEEYFTFKRNIEKFKNKVIIEAYNRDCFDWKS